MKVAAIAAVLVFVPSLLGVPAPKDGATDNQRIQGTWAAVSGEIGGKPSKIVLLLKLVFEKDKVSIHHTEEGEPYEFKLDPSRKPKALDIVTEDETLLVIYALDGDTLKLCFNNPCKGVRPTEFATKPGTDLTLVEFKRVRK